jgi:anthranilate synthase component 1
VVPEFHSNLSRPEVEAMVERIVRYIHAGDAFQVVPSQRFSAPVDVEAFSIYRGLRAVNPSPYMYFLDFGDFEIAGASPEPLITVAGRRVATRPVAGTRPRRTSASPPSCSPTRRSVPST